MKQHITDLITQALEQLQQQDVLPSDISPRILVDRTKDKSHGDWASNIALTLAKAAGKPPRELAQAICDALPSSEQMSKTEIAGPGFINFFVTQASTTAIVPEILQQADNFGRNQTGAGQSVQVEFVSANPTGPLHVGHGRGAAYGASGASLLEACGFNVHREYYVNDAGRQMDILATSVWLRYLQTCGSELAFPSNGYQGDYVQNYAADLNQQHGDQFQRDLADVFTNVPADEPAGGDKELHIDGLIANAKQLLGDDYETVFSAGLDGILADIRDDLGEFGVDYQEWFSERSLTQSPSQVDKAITKLQAAGFIDERDGALWFRSTHFGDDKDRVVKRDNGLTTYFASDIAYHLNKFERGFDRVINIWGADHHGYVARVKAALTAMELDPDKLDVRLVQFAILYRGQERVPMSTRSGSFVTLRELRDEVGSDAARFFYVTRKAEQHMDFDLELAKSQSKDNPIYYIQYAHARVCSVLRKLDSEVVKDWQPQQGLQHLDKLTNDHELALLGKLGKYPEVVKAAGVDFEPHLLAHYLRDLAADFHTYYNAHKVLIDDTELRDARLCLGVAVRQVIFNGLTLLGVSAPEEM